MNVKSKTGVVDEIKNDNIPFTFDVCLDGFPYCSLGKLSIRKLPGLLSEREIPP